MTLGISSYTFGWAVSAHALDEIGLLDWAQAHEIRVLQIGDNLPLHTFDAARLERLGAHAAQDGITLEIGAKGLTPERINVYTDIARCLDSPLIRFVADDGEYQPSASEIVSILRDALPRLGTLTLALENHDRFPAVQLQSILEAVNDPRVGLCLDTANSLGAGEGINEVAARLAPWTVNLHLKDFTVERLPYLMGFTVSGRPAGGGMLDIPALLALLSPYERCHSAILELWTPPEAQMADTLVKEAAWAEASIVYLRPLFQRGQQTGP